MAEVIGYSQELYRNLASETTCLPVINMGIASAIARTISNCYIKKGVQISRLHPKRDAVVIKPFPIHITEVEDGYVATSDICNIYELEATRGDAVRNYLYSLVDELIWLEKEENNLSPMFLEQLKEIRNHIRIA